MNDKERALEKIKQEVEKDISNAVLFAEKCGLLELLYFVYQLHWIRLLDSFPNSENVNKNLVSAYSNQLDESLKYIISLIAKFGTWAFAMSKEKNVPILQLELVQVLLKHANYINSKYEGESLIKLFDVEVSGERDRYLKIDFSTIHTNEEMKIFFDYFLRVDFDNNIKKNNKKNRDALLINFADEYEPVEDLFQQEMNITLSEYCQFIKDLIQKISSKIEENKPKYKILENGNVDVTHQRTFLAFIHCFIFDKDKLLGEFDERYITVFNRLFFDPNSFDEKQLRFHYLTRKPILVNKGFLIISPELLLDSLFTNIHYSLIESPNIKQQYIARKATIFLNTIAEIGLKFNYVEIDREFDLFEGKQQIGDIDLILCNSNNDFLLIEAKNHALPMDIYFKDVQKTKEHLFYLQTKWENKVMQRVNHLEKNHLLYGIPQSFRYIVVSRFPEIISHFSKLLVLSIQEFEVWLKDFPETVIFDDFHTQYYSNKEQTFSIEEIREMEKDNLLFGHFAKK